MGSFPSDSTQLDTSYFILLHERICYLSTQSDALHCNPKYTRIDHQACLVKRPDIGQVCFFPSAFEFPFSLSCFLISVFLLPFFCSFMISIVCYPFSFLLLLYVSRSVYFFSCPFSLFRLQFNFSFCFLFSVNSFFFPFPVLVLSACSICALSRNKSFTHIGHRTGALSGQGLQD